MEVSGKTSLVSRTNDTWITTKVRTRMMTNRDVPSDQIKIVVENGTVYLMGLISEMEGDNAANVARNVSGVSRVVKVFEYIN
jgi:osmotically-inducible protein OsmY